MKKVLLAIQLKSLNTSDKEERSINCIDYELISKSLQIIGYDVELIDISDCKSGARLLQNCEVDGVYCSDVSGDAYEHALISQPIRIVNLVLVSKEAYQGAVTICRINQANMKVGICENDYRIDSDLMKRLDRIEIYKDYDHIINALVSDEIQIGLLDEVLNANAIKRRELKINGDTDLNIKKSKNIFFNCINSTICSEFNSGLKKLIETNQYFEITKYWSSKK